MDFEYTPEQEAFREVVRTWLAQNLPADLCIDDPMDERREGRPTWHAWTSGI